MSGEQHPVSKPNTYWAIMTSTWDLVDTLWGGTRAMRDAGTTYLPQEPAEEEPAYNNRKDRSVLTPYYPDAIKKLIGKILKQPVVLEDDVPPKVLMFMDDIDSAGTDINEWTKQIGLAALNHGVTYILVDYPDILQIEERGAPVTREDELSGVLRPYAVHIKAPQILGWKTEIIDGQVTLIQVRIMIVSQEDSTEDEFSQVMVKRIHVWEIGRLRIYREDVDEDGNAEWVVESDKAVTLEFIPLFPVYGGKEDFFIGTPPLLDVAHLNVTHYQSDSDQRNILHVARVPLLFGSGLGDEDRGDFQIQVGPNTMTHGPQGSDMKYVEHSGKGIDSGEKDLDSLTERMAKLGLNMVTKRPTGDVSATGKVLDQAEADSPLGMFARHLEAKLEQMLDLFAFYLDLGEDSGGSVTLFKDFSISQRDSTDISSLAGMRIAGDISQRTYWEELKRRNLLNEDFDPDKEIDLLDLEFQDSQLGLTEAEDSAGNSVGDETASADGHTHILQEDGVTNTVDGHNHSWEPTGSTTGEANDHFHNLKGIADDVENSREGQSDEGETSAGSGGQQQGDEQGSGKSSGEGSGRNV